MKKPRRRKEPAARIVLVLHAHLPYARVPSERFPAQELWLYQNMAECYIPLLRVLTRLADEGVRFPLTASLSPTLGAMLGDAHYRERLPTTSTASSRSRACTPCPGALLAMRSRYSPTDWRKRARTGTTRAPTWPGPSGPSPNAARRRSSPPPPRTRSFRPTATAWRSSGCRYAPARSSSRAPSAPRRGRVPEMGYTPGSTRPSPPAASVHLPRGALRLSGADSPEHGNFMPFASESGLVVFPRSSCSPGRVGAPHRIPGDGATASSTDYTWQMSELELARQG